MTDVSGTGKPRCLFLSPMSPYPPDFGAAQRSFLLLQALRESHDVDLVLVNNHVYPPETIEVLRRDFNFIGQIPADNGSLSPWHWRNYMRMLARGKYLRRGLRAWLASRETLFRSMVMSSKLAEVAGRRTYDCIVTRYLWPAVQADAFALGSVFIDVDDLPSEVWHSRVESLTGSTRWCSRHIWQDYAVKEKQYLQLAKGVWVAKPKDRESLAGLAHVGLLPNVPFASYPLGVKPLPASLLANPVVMGVGIFDWPPNRQGFEWFIKSVWPRVMAKRSDARLHVVGKMSDHRVIQEWGSVPGVHCLGRVEDLKAEYQRATVAVAPIFTGGGTNIKVIEALSFGRPCVITPHAAKGFDGIDGLQIAGDPDAFAQACLDLLNNPDRAEALGLKGAASIGHVFSYEAFKGAVQGLLAGAAPQGSSKA